MGPMNDITVRFAPSPTGYLHVGGARTGLFNWLFARHHGGTFILRIEDTDRNRSTEEAIDQIIGSLEWLGLDWDVFARQTDRIAEHLAAAEKLKATGHAYEEEGALWFRCPSEGTTSVEDVMLGRVDFLNSELKDFVILRSDRTPTYNFACVVDDASMGITHVIRGHEHLNNTPRQVLMYHALGLPLPRFAHIPLILGPDRSKLSKRHGAVSVLEYRERGYLPEAVMNFLARLGWSHGDQEIFSREELVALFDLPAVGTSAAIFDESKLQWLNHEWMHRVSTERLAHLLAERIMAAGVATAEELEEVGSARLGRTAELLRERGKTLTQMAQWAWFVFPREARVAQEDQELFTPEICSALGSLADAIEQGADASPESMEKTVRAALGEAGVPLKIVGLPLRVAVTGSRVGPNLFDLLAVTGPVLVAQRLREVSAPEGTRGIHG